MINSSHRDRVWQSPPEPIVQILDAPPPALIFLSPDREWMVELERFSLVPIAQSVQKVILLAGLRWYPQTNGPARYSPCYSLKYRKLAAETAIHVDLPENPQISFLRWSPDSQKLAFTLTQPDGLELWVLDLTQGETRRLTEPILNGVWGSPYNWLNNDTLVCKCVPPQRGEAPVAPEIPPGPLIQENQGQKRPERTHTHLLKTDHDEALLEYYLTSVLNKITLDGADNDLNLLPPSLIYGATPSPDGKFILLKTIHRPFSHEVQVSCFPLRTEIIDDTGKLIYQVADLPTYERPSTKRETVRQGPRRINWRGDRPATLYWVEALDEGDPNNEVPFRDVLFELDAPFTGEPKQLWRSQYRFRNVRWGKDDLAVVVEGWYETRKQRTWRIYPQQPETPAKLLFDRSTEDKYDSPGVPLMTTGEYGYRVLRFAPEGNTIYLSGRGTSPQGVYPFLDKFNLETAEKERLWQCEDPYFEGISYLLDSEAQTVITNRQSPTEPPNYFLFNRSDPAKQVALTNYQDPAPQLAGMQKELLKYRRADGVKLSAKLYLPPGYNAERDGPLPILFWVYPQEFKDAEFAGQLTTAENAFVRPWGASVLFLLTQGYGILSGPTLPIIGEGDTQPNDTYVGQLLAGAQAAVDCVVERGVADPKRIGVGGHSYGAFTTVNLLAHTDLFQMGIARSGAYNRTLTPFGFQEEQRNYWEAQETYTQMSPFTHVDKVKVPLLLIHGASDDHHSTYPAQTKRLYQALKGLGGNVRWVSLPFQRHSYSSREAVAHVLWEMTRWCELYL